MSGEDEAYEAWLLARAWDHAMRVQMKILTGLYANMSKVCFAIQRDRRGNLAEETETVMEVAG